MDTNITTVGILAFLKAIFPSALGAILAVWYKRGEVTWSDLSFTRKLFLCFMVLVAFICGTLISHYLSAAILEPTSIPMDSWRADGLKIFIGISSLKLIDHTIKNIDPLLETIFKNVHSIVNLFFTGLTTKIKSWFKMGE
jgi:hypothetical protein